MHDTLPIRRQACESRGTLQNSGLPSYTCPTARRCCHVATDILDGVLMLTHVLTRDISSCGTCARSCCTACLHCTFPLSTIQVPSLPSAPLEVQPQSGSVLHVVDHDHTVVISSLSSHHSVTSWSRTTHHITNVWRVVPADSAYASTMHSPSGRMQCAVRCGMSMKRGSTSLSFNAWTRDPHQIREHPLLLHLAFHWQLHHLHG